MSGNNCIFSILPLSFECAKEFHLPCNGQLEKLSSLNGVVQTFECEHAVDLLLIRGGILVDWSDGNKVREVLEMFVCSHHKTKLLTSWKCNKFANKVNNRNQHTCSLHKIIHVQGTKPLSQCSLSKTNTLKLIEATGRFFHVGTGICKQHHAAICDLKYESLSFSDKIDIAKDANQNDVQNESEDLDGFQSFSDDDESRLDSQSINTEDQRSIALREIAALFGISRLTSERNWTSLKPETRKKKVVSMLHLHDELFKLTAGSEWELMKKECIIKTGQIVDSSRVTAILQSIEERLEETTDRRAKLSLVSILTGHFTEREIIHATGMSRYFVREAKKYALYGLDEVAKFRRVKHNLPILKQFIGFISLPDIMVYLPNPARSLTLSSGDAVSLATVARLHSYRQVVNMYKKFIEEKGIKECAATGGDVKETHAIWIHWFGKSGISFHISHCLISNGGTRFHHTFGHLNDEWKQDSTAICIIADHVFKTLAENGVKKIILRSDNAGSYRNAAVVHTLHVTAVKYGVRLVAYLFSEPQYGKGAADRQISHSKRKLVDEVDKGGYGRTAEEILKSLCTEPLLKSFSFYTINGSQVKRAEGTIPDITMLSSFRYEKERIRVRKFDTIGDGVLISYDKLEGLEVNYEINSSGGHLSMSTGFWGELSDTPPKQKESKASCEESEEEEADKKFRCREGNCTMKYLTINGLSKHMLVGKHKEREHSDTIIDAAAKIFSETVETNETAYLSMMTDSFSSSLSHVRSLKLTEGWSLRVKRKIVPIDSDVRRLVRKYFVGRRKEGKRAEARFVVGMLREKTEVDGSYVFPLKKCLKESQAQGLIGRFLKVESSKKGLAALESDGEDAIEEGEEEEGTDAESEAIDTLGVKPVKKGRGRPKKAELTTGTKQTTRKVKRSAAKKTTVTSKKLLQSDQDSDESEGHEDEGEEHAVTAPVIEQKVIPKRRGRPPKKNISENAEIAMKGRGRKKKDDSATTSTIPPSTRVLRDRKRKTEEEKFYYQEISSDDELDDFTLMMNTVMEEENFKEIFSEVE